MSDSGPSSAELGIDLSKEQTPKTGDLPSKKLPPQSLPETRTYTREEVEARARQVTGGEMTHDRIAREVASQMTGTAPNLPETPGIPDASAELPPPPGVSGKWLNGLGRYDLATQDLLLKAMMDDAVKKTAEMTAGGESSSLGKQVFADLTPEEAKVVEEAKKTKRYGDFEVVEMDTYRGKGRFKLKFPDTGKEVWAVPGMKNDQQVDLYLAPDPKEDEVSTEEKARVWIEEEIRKQERTNAGRIINPALLQSWGATLTEKIPEHHAGFQEEMIETIRARFHYHNASFEVASKLGDFGEEFREIQTREHEIVRDTVGVREALAELTVNKGTFFRMDTAAANVERNRIRGMLEADARIIAEAEYAAEHNPNPARRAVERDRQIRDKARRALELAEKTSHIFGESAECNGLVDAAGDLVEPTGVTYEDALQNYADYIENNWGYIAGLPPNTLLEGQGAGNMRRIFHYPIWLQKEDEGQVTSLRRYAFLWVASAKRARNMGSLTDLLDNIGAHRSDLVGWAGDLSTAHNSREVFFKKGDASVLNLPLIDPNGVSTEDTATTLPKSLENVKRAMEGYEHLSGGLKGRAVTHLLEGILRYMNDKQETARDGFSWLGWNQKIQKDALLWALSLRLITQREMLAALAELEISRNRSAFQAAAPHLRKGLFAGLRAFFKAIVKQ